jgi:hypothetical protein
LSGSRIGSIADGASKPAQFSLLASHAIQALLEEESQSPELTFLPRSPLGDGKLSRANLQASVRVGRASLMVAKEKRQ